MSDSDPPREHDRGREDSDVPGTELPSGRMTLDLTGPPLTLPGDEEDGDSDVPIPLRPSAPSIPPAGGHDGWTRDRARRSTLDDEALLQVFAERIDEGASNVAADSPADSINLAPSLPPGAPDPDNPGAFGLIERTRPSYPVPDAVEEMRARFALDDFSAALRAAEWVLGRDAGHSEAQVTRAAARKRLEDLYRSRIGSGSAVPRVVVPAAEVRWLGLDHQAAYLLSRIDGRLTIEELLDICGMDPIDALKAFALLVDSQAVAMQEG